MFSLVFSNRFSKDVKLLKKRGFDMEVLKIAILELEENGQLTNRYNPHKLSGNYTGFWEALPKPDWLLIWSVYPDDKEIWLTLTGSHADLF
jgi:mRNA interferase YafQ